MTQDISKIIIISSVMGVLVWAALWIVPIWAWRTISDHTYHAPTAQSIRQEQYDNCLHNASGDHAPDCVKVLQGK